MAMIGGIQTALSGMKANQMQLDVIGRNIVNVNTEGYTKKYYQQNSVVLDSRGVGVSLSNVQRTVDENLLKSFLSGNSINAKLYSENKYLSGVEDFIGTPSGDNSIAANLTSLQTMLENLSTNVTSSAARFELVNSAKTFAERLNYLSTNIQKLRTEADQEIATQITEVNKTLDKLQNINDQVVKAKALGYDSLPDLLDQRDNELRNLSQYMEINYYQRENGEIVIQTADGVNLLDKDPHYLSHSPAALTNSMITYNGGGISGIYVDGKDITQSLTNGSIKGLVNIRDTTLPSLQAQLDELAGTMRQAVNAEHNLGTSFPNLAYELNGTRTFVDSSAQQIKIENGDVRFTVFDKDGNQIKTTTLGQDLGFTQGSVDSMTTALEAWLKSPAGGNLPQATAAVDANGNFRIDTGDSEFTISITDVKTPQLGAEQKPVTIQFDANGDGTFDTTHEGFSNFFGLNDFFVRDSKEMVYDSKIVNKNVNLGLTGPATLSFSDTKNGLNYASITINPGEKIQDIVNKINNDPTLNQDVKASLVPSGNGYILRVVNSGGDQMEIAETGTNTGIMNRLGLEHSNAEASTSLAVREDLLTNPGLVSVGGPQYDNTSGQYKLSSSANDVINNMAKTFTDPHNFIQTGTLASISTTFANYASSFVGVIASASSSTQSDLTYQMSMLESIATKEALISQVDMDEELANLIIFQQSYSACAQAFTANKEMIDMILNLV